MISMTLIHFSFVGNFNGLTNLNKDYKNSPTASPVQLLHCGFTESTVTATFLQSALVASLTYKTTTNNNMFHLYSASHSKD